MIRFGLIGDIHAEDERLAAALRLFETRGVEQTLFVGDVVDGDGDVDRCCALLAARESARRARQPRPLALGRNDAVACRAPTCAKRSPRQSIALLESLPRGARDRSARGTILLCHGVGEDDMQRLRPDDDGYALESNEALEALLRAGRYAIAVGGHTHERMVRRFTGTAASSPSSTPGRWRATPPPAARVLDLEAGRVRFLDLDDPSTPTQAEELALTA